MDGENDGSGSQLEESYPLQLLETQPEGEGLNALTVGASDSVEILPPSAEVSELGDGDLRAVAQEPLKVEVVEEPAEFRTVDDAVLLADLDVFESAVEVGALAFGKVGSRFLPGVVVGKEGRSFKIRLSDGTVVDFNVAEIFPDSAMRDRMNVLICGGTEATGVLLGYKKNEGEADVAKRFHAIVRVTEEPHTVLKAVPRSDLALNPVVVAQIMNRTDDKAAESRVAFGIVTQAEPENIPVGSEPQSQPSDSSLLPLSGDVSLPEMSSTPVEQVTNSSGNSAKGGEVDSELVLTNGDGAQETPSTGESNSDASGYLAGPDGGNYSSTTETKEGSSLRGSVRFNTASSGAKSTVGSLFDRFTAPSPPGEPELRMTGKIVGPFDVEIIVRNESGREKLKEAYKIFLKNFPASDVKRVDRRKSSSSSSNRRSNATMDGYGADLSSMGSSDSPQDRAKKKRDSVEIVGESYAKPSSPALDPIEENVESPSRESKRERGSFDSPGVELLPLPSSSSNPPQEIVLVSSPEVNPNPPVDVVSPSPLKKPRGRKKKIGRPRKNAGASARDNESTETDGNEPKPRRPPHRRRAAEPPASPPTTSAAEEEPPRGAEDLTKAFFKGTKVYARWTAGLTGYFPGKLVEEKNGFWLVQFEDGSKKKLGPDEIFPQYRLVRGTAVSYTLDKGNYENRIGAELVSFDDAEENLVLKRIPAADSSVDEDTEEELVEVPWTSTFLTAEQCTVLFRAENWKLKSAAGTLQTAAITLESVIPDRTRASNSKFGTPLRPDNSFAGAGPSTSGLKRARGSGALASGAETSGSAATPRKRHKGDSFTGSTFTVKKTKGLRNMLKGFAFVLSFVEETPAFLPEPLDYVEREADEDFVVTAEDEEYTRENLKMQLEYCGAFVRDSVDELVTFMGDGIAECLLISNRVSTTKAYLKAAAAGLPICSVGWILEMLSKAAFFARSPAHVLRQGVTYPVGKHSVGKHSYASQRLFQMKVGLTSAKADVENAGIVTNFWNDVLRIGQNFKDVFVFKVDEIDDAFDAKLVVADGLDDEKTQEIQNKYSIPIIKPDWVLTQLKRKTHDVEAVENLVAEAKN